MLPQLFALLWSTDWAESFMMMEELTSMFSSLSTNVYLSETSAPSISTHLIQTSNRFHVHLTSLSTMPERMTTSFMNTERDLENLELLLEDVNGYTATLFLLKLKKDFLHVCGKGLQEITCFILEQSPDLQTPITLPRRPITIRRPLRRTESGESMTGLVNQASEESWEEDA